MHFGRPGYIGGFYRRVPLGPSGYGRVSVKALRAMKGFLPGLQELFESRGSGLYRSARISVGFRGYGISS